MGQFLTYWQRFRSLFYFLCACFLLYALVPRAQHFFYEYQRGKVWTYGTLTAPYDIPLRKTPNQLRRERQQIEQELRPIFVEDTSVSNRVRSNVLGNLQSSFALYQDSVLNHRATTNANDSFGNIPHNAFRTRLDALLHYLYKVGIVETRDVLRATNTGEFSVLRSRIAYQTSLTDVYSPRTAAAYLEREMNRFALSSTERVFWEHFDVVRYLTPNLGYDSLLSVQQRTEAFSTLSQYRGVIKKGERIVTKGDLITEEIYQQLESLRQETEGHLRHGFELFLSELSYIFLLFTAFGVLYYFLSVSYPNILSRQRETLFLLLLCVLMLGVGFLVVRFAPRFLYLVPLVLVPFLVRTFYDARLSLVTHLLIVATLAFFAPDSYRFTMLHSVAGVVAVLGSRNIFRRGHLFHQVFLVLLTYTSLYSVVSYLQEDLSLAHLEVLSLFAGNALLTLASYQFSYPLERTFGFVSNVSLLELCDTNQPLLRELSSRAPGTFQHSIQVANLAEAAAAKISANALLIRAGALYHDIGKMLNPEYFVENQADGITPHAHLNELESAEVIIRHVLDGLHLAHKYRIPNQIADFICTHHGTTRTEYFYRTYCAAHPEAPVAEIAPRFTYPGPRPHSREMALLMMADSIEAASRTLKQITPDTLTELVNRIVEHQQSSGQFDDAELTLKDIADAKSVFISKLQNFYHARIEYPPSVDDKK